LDHLLQFLAVGHDQLSLDRHHRHATRGPRRRNRHRRHCSSRVPGGRAAPCSATIAATSTISSGVAPRDRSDIGRAHPWSSGPAAVARAKRSVSLYAMLPASSEGKTSTFARPPTRDAGYLRIATSGTSAVSTCI